MEYLVRDLMVPISEYATVPQGSTLYDAVVALEKAQEQYEHSKYLHRAILIMDKNKRVVGKLGQLDVLRAIISGSPEMEGIEQIARFGFGPGYIASIREEYRLKGRHLNEICMEPAKMRVEDFMQTPSAGEHIDGDAHLEQAIYRLSMGPYQSLMVTKKDEIIGILRMADVFAAVFHAMKENKNKVSET
jgi:CBS domain containing-hemolysin-like protein